MIGFRVTVTGDLSGPLEGLMRGLGGAGRREILTEIADTALRVTWENFGENGANRPSEWPPLSPRYQKAIGYFGPPKLILEGDLISSIRTLDLSDDSVTIGTEIEYASVHQFGAGFVPARPYFPFYGDASGAAMMTPFLEEKVNQAVERKLVELTGANP